MINYFLVQIMIYLFEAYFILLLKTFLVVFECEASKNNVHILFLYILI